MVDNVIDQYERIGINSGDRMKWKEGTTSRAEPRVLLISNGRFNIASSIYIEGGTRGDRSCVTTWLNFDHRT
ncbi:hypothetical protein EVAR_86113_1 [Eumeta japonica]|uniref:Uncharacterized protein n=1 Tax=Eumeta variegata TaxID=151549 RepID=A0A4C1V0L5_EUMVA|nr:hypothetical protein EVAR_86113_1 [Eumeta japonica]